MGEADLTMEEVRERIEAIRRLSEESRDWAGRLRPDNEVCHQRQDELYLLVLKYYAAGGTAPGMALEALRVEAIEFTRWYD